MGTSKVAELTSTVAALEAQIKSMTAMLSAIQAKAGVKAPEAKPARKPVDLTGAPAASKIDVVCAEMFRDREAWVGTKQHPILWSIGRRVALWRQSASPAQVKAAQIIVCENRAKYSRFFE